MMYTVCASDSEAGLLEPDLIASLISKITQLFGHAKSLGIEVVLVPFFSMSLRSMAGLRVQVSYGRSEQDSRIAHSRQEYTIS